MMPIAFERNSGNTIERPRFIHGMQCISIYGPREKEVFAGGRRGAMEGEEDLDSCNSSSIGRNSDVSGDSSDGEDSGDTEVQSSYKGPLDTMDALEEVLPIRRGISKFYSGKSKSFTSLSDTSSVSSIKDLAKPENSYNRKRKNLLAHSFWDKNLNYPLMRNNGSGISKKPAKPCRSTLNLGATSSSSESNNNSEDSNLISSSPSCCLPPRHPQAKISPSNRSSSPPSRRNPPWRSFSLSDLQCVSSATPNITKLALCNGDKDNELH